MNKKGMFMLYFYETVIGLGLAVLAIVLLILSTNTRLDAADVQAQEYRSEYLALQGLTNYARTPVGDYDSLAIAVERYFYLSSLANPDQVQQAEAAQIRSAIDDLNSDVAKTLGHHFPVNSKYVINAQLYLLDNPTEKLGLAGFKGEGGSGRENSAWVNGIKVHVPSSIPQHRIEIYVIKSE